MKAPDRVGIVSGRTIAAVPLPQEICVRLRSSAVQRFELWALEFGIFLELGAWRLELLLRQEGEQSRLFQRLPWPDHDGREVLVMDGVGIMLRLQANSGMS